MLQAAASKDRLALAKVESSGFGKAKPSEALHRLSLLLALKPGSVVAHRTWGYGVVKAEDDFYRNMTVEFDDEPGRPKALGFAFAAEALSPIGPEHLLAVRHADGKEAFGLKCRNDPGAVVKLALKSYGNLTVSQLQSKLEPVLPAGDDWKHFWERARKQLAADGEVRLPAAAKKAEAVEVAPGKKPAADAEKSPDEAQAAKEAARDAQTKKECAALLALRDPKEILEKVAAIEKKGALSDDQRAAIADRIGFVLKASVADRKKLGNAVKVRAAMLGLDAGLADVSVSLRPGAEGEFAFAAGSGDKAVDLLRTVSRPDLVLDAAATLPASHMEKLMDRILPVRESKDGAGKPVRKFVPALEGADAAFAAVLSEMPANLMEHIAPRLLRGPDADGFKDAVREELKKPRPSFQLLRWLCHAAALKDLKDEVYAVVPPFALVSIVAVALGNEAVGEALRMKNDVKKLFVAGRRDPGARNGAKSAEIDEGCKWLDPLMADMSADERASVFARLSALEGVWEPLKKRRLLDFLRKTYAGIEELPETDEAEEKLEAFVRHGITSARSYNERRASLDKLVKEDIPQNIKDIEYAKSFGDLSENFEYQIARDKERELQARQTQLQKDLAEVSAFDFSDVAQNGLAGVGSFVTIREEGGAEKSYAILGEWDSDPDLGIVSSKSRVAEALFGAAEGDKVEMPGEDGASAVATVLSVAALPEAVLAWARG